MICSCLVHPTAARVSHVQRAENQVVWELVQPRDLHLPLRWNATSRSFYWIRTGKEPRFLNFVEQLDNDTLEEADRFVMDGCTGTWSRLVDRTTRAHRVQEIPQATRGCNRLSLAHMITTLIGAHIL